MTGVRRRESVSLEVRKYHHHCILVMSTDPWTSLQLQGDPRKVYTHFKSIDLFCSWMYLMLQSVVRCCRGRWRKSKTMNYKQILKSAKRKVYTPQLLHALNEHDNLIEECSFLSRFNTWSMNMISVQILPSTLFNLSSNIFKFYRSVFQGQLLFLYKGVIWLSSANSSVRPFKKWHWWYFLTLVSGYLR